MFGFFKKKTKSKEESDSLFQIKFHHFQSLLRANDETHKIMSEMGQMIAFGQPFTKGFANKKFNNLLENTQKVVDELIAMSGGRYTKLRDKLDEIKSYCYKILTPRIFCPEGWDCDTYECHVCTKTSNHFEGFPHPMRITEIDDSYGIDFGYKMSRLGEVYKKLFIPVPDGFCISHRLFEIFMQRDNVRKKIDVLR
ncbi:MAG: pyruvate, water dikinase [Bacteroidota bacterium]|nr:pyruvate, water dikinase [Bacteroidota bacterium]